MLGAEILAFFREHPLLGRHFKGIFAADQIGSLRLSNRSAAVVNTDSLEEEGAHWWTVSRLEDRLEVFDPLGTTQEEVIERLGNKKFFYFNASPVQPEDSVDCGVYCIYWICTRLYNSDKKYSEVLY